MRQRRMGGRSFAYLGSGRRIRRHHTRKYRSGHPFFAAFSIEASERERAVVRSGRRRGNSNDHVPSRNGSAREFDQTLELRALRFRKRVFEGPHALDPRLKPRRRGWRCMQQPPATQHGLPLAFLNSYKRAFVEAKMSKLPCGLLAQAAQFGSDRQPARAARLQGEALLKRASLQRPREEHRDNCRSSGAYER
jgi:hypothetical protein